MSSRFRLPAILTLPLAGLLALAAAGALFIPSVYAREVPLWAAQGRGQDWVDLVFVVPLMIAAALLTLRGSRRAVLVLAGTLAYALYSLVLYAFFLHFGPLFLVYAWALGLSFFAFVALAGALHADDARAWFDATAPVRLAGGLSVLLGVLFYALWLGEIVPAIVSGQMPRSAADAGLVTNPVHVLDLGIVLPAFIVGGVALWRRRRLGYWLGPAMLAFGVVMDVALAGMAVSMRASGMNEGPPLGVFVTMTLVNGAVLALLLRGCRRG